MGNAFDILAAEYRPMVLCYLRAIVRDEHLAEDLTQETMLAAHRAIESFDSDRNFGAWLRGIARNKVLEDQRAVARRPLVVDSAVVEGMEQVYSLFDHSPGPWETRVDRVHACIGRLAETMRAAVRAVYQQGLSLKQAASALDVSFDALAQRLSRSRRFIRQCVESSTPENKETEHV